jgi:cyclic pyranopterin phosphate synthase
MTPTNPIYDFDEADGPLSLLPTAARRALDLAGVKLSLEGWRSLSTEDRKALVTAGAVAAIDPEVVKSLAAGASPPPSGISPVGDPNPNDPPAELLEALGQDQQLSAEKWASLSPLDRYALSKVGRRGPCARLNRAYAEIVRSGLSHLTEAGEAHMVGVGGKTATARRAVATARVIMQRGTLARLIAGNAPKGDVLATARIAGIQAAKRTWELIPLCHPIALTGIEIDIKPIENGEPASVLVRVTADAFDRTGVEMEALVAASTAALTIYDMLKGIDRWMTITDVRLEEKSGGRSGSLRREPT